MYQMCRSIEAFVLKLHNFQNFQQEFSCFSYAYIELWMHLGIWKSTQEARVPLRCASNNSYAPLVLSKLPACIHNSIYAR